MRGLKMGGFFSNSDQTFGLNGLILTDTVYAYSYVDWHYHEHDYFTFILHGEMLEGKRQELFHYMPGGFAASSSP